MVFVKLGYRLLTPNSYLWSNRQYEYRTKTIQFSISKYTALLKFSMEYLKA